MSCARSHLLVHTADFFPKKSLFVGCWSFFGFATSAEVNNGLLPTASHVFCSPKLHPQLILWQQGPQTICSKSHVDDAICSSGWDVPTSGRLSCDTLNSACDPAMLNSACDCSHSGFHRGHGNEGERGLPLWCGRQRGNQHVGRIMC